MISQYLVNAYLPLITAASNNGFEDLPMDIPKLSSTDITIILTLTKDIFKLEPTLLHINQSCIIVGDLHGNIRDLLRIFAKNGLPPKTKYVFLGDYVDRGEFSIEIVSLLFSLKILHPNDIHLIRGNHEFLDINTIYGFKNQVLEEYSEALYEVFNDCFGYLPLACILNDAFFLVHGGLSPKLTSVKQIEEVQRPIHKVSDLKPQHQFVVDMLWSDPDDSDILYLKNLRGFGFIFGAAAALNFLRANNLQKIIRSHQCVNAIQEHCGSAVITVFSSSNYSSKSNNTSGVLEVNGSTIYTGIYEAQDQYKKIDASYRNVELVERVPYCFNSKFSSRLKSSHSVRRATYDEIKKSETKKSIKGISSLPKLVCSPMKPIKNEINPAMSVPTLSLDMV
ncbi:Ser/Thr protein phosphatase, putative [Trichomonas vaginalis G3]|uniref:Serine/threonine-protein phosphatase n=1 Tax=Trichomonas vaginalis (strain ATCC PRA-98 / G3) TaxID=412133 RepID=A2FEY0_TRIV3|nr:phosphoprotein phosphatase protein [Trichomonas vaginalis G3]EAX96534.1 Ser/Thr protein phosphatase, putative [Trichomonas vaginalis G3]KAI5541098.1 phosphoprotein phosphatase protein [Trichomonas vaginalis G3]|eukprot:XP_001309464.1 Ser/Thr protein phosphatase [Trichomonas vaginalis G3]